MCFFFRLATFEQKKLNNTSTPAASVWKGSDCLTLFDILWLTLAICFCYCKTDMQYRTTTYSRWNSPPKEWLFELPSHPPLDPELDWSSWPNGGFRFVIGLPPSHHPKNSGFFSPKAIQQASGYHDWLKAPNWSQGSCRSTGPSCSFNTTWNLAASARSTASWSRAITTKIFSSSLGHRENSCGKRWIFSQGLRLKVIRNRMGYQYVSILWIKQQTEIVQKSCSIKV